MIETWQRGFVLHRREYSETSLLVDLFTEEYGRLTVLAKGARAKRSPWKGVLQPFTPLLLRWGGRGELKILTKAEPAALALPLSQIALLSGFYLNELLVRVLENETPYPSLFQDYLFCLTNLATSQSVEPHLRRFEFRLLTALGYGIDFCHCAGTGLLVDDDMTYRYREEKGFIASLIVDNLTFYGRELLAFERLQFTDKQVLQAAKRFTRIALKPYLGGKPLKSRELFQQHLLYLKKR
ncbi:DNA repair protein RecO [Mergibacter septicus]|uniref:DNA repair protein RecO n=1 Tax=Mergibacter septicus TaxID=221402 RepID=A0A8D4LNL8_9PAST|nr:DNA repair protein RecO [Mergibacter septicus]AWX13953.1 DNA repair protein RecO [Mergibacter septicus]AWX15948.1 DNA repair protein RecO [Mergibacter septicus]QDJ13424.1 DNA repair protein RecO [Mergibacter septicus]QDJ15201.1 DNA repair protein RecO [Mergibacter septicus]UTU47378.1 DNA repair protein RecO [Mergibacter septicus]